MKAKRELEKEGVHCWMDISGGMQADIFDSMAEGVRNAACVVCFMTKKYQDSSNCALELKFAKQSGVPIVPVMMEPRKTGQPWHAGGWLGIITAGKLWTPMYDEASFEENLPNVIRQIKVALRLAADDEDEFGLAAELDVVDVVDARNELERLRDEASPALNTDLSGPCKLPAHVMDLPSGLQVYDEMQQLLSLVTSASSKQRIGFTGMGGIGKTTIASWIARQDSCRSKFDLILWIPLGQDANVQNCQDLLLTQFSGGHFDDDVTSEKRKEELKQLIASKKVLLVLDDLWEAEHLQSLDVVDDTTESKVLISSRVRGVLEGAEIVDIGLPSDDDAVAMLLSYADLTLPEPPVEALEIVKYCNHLPLAIGIAGKFVKDLDMGTGAADWGEVLEEMRTDTDASGQKHSREEGIITTSLKGIKGAAASEILTLFKSLALLAEDAQCALDVIPVIFHAEAGDAAAKPPSLIRIRKWLKVLIDRSLILGPIDRPSLHDIVRDYVVGRHTEKELKDAHRVLVAYFRAARPKDPFGRPQWDSTLAKHDKVTAYIIEHAGYHIVQGWGEDMESDELAIGGWLGDTPQDELVLAAGRVLGVPKLISRADQAEAGTEWWLAARLHNVARNLLAGSEGSGAATTSLLKCLDALANIEPENERDDMELELLYELLMVSNRPELMTRGAQIFKILQTDAKSRNPIAAAMMSKMMHMKKSMAGDRPTIEAANVGLVRALVVDGAQNPDPDIQVKCLLVGLSFAGFGMEKHVRLLYHPTLSIWDSLGAEKWLEATEVYNFALHSYLVSKTVTDAGIQYPGYVNWLLMRMVSVTKAFEWM